MKMHRTQTLRPLNALLKQALHSRTLKRAALGIGAFAPAFAFANPTGGQVVAGNAGITVPDQNHTIINQASQNAIINWQQFSIGSDQFVQFIQPDSSAGVLNRVVGGDPSQILGNLSANGQVFLVNPNGVFFGQGASLDVQGLIATTLDIKDNDFMAGNYVFAKGDGAPDAGVTNQGTLRANNGYIVLAGDYANNDGVIAAQAGQVVLASGNQMTLTLADDSLVSFVVDQATMAQYAGVSNTGSIEADGGVVLMTAKVANALTATAVNNSGLVTAHSIEDHGGTIILAAQGGDIDESGTLDASAIDPGVAGGHIRIRGDGHTEIASTTVITTEGDQANGGFIELSGHTLNVRGIVDTGKDGTLLIDPSIITITSGGTTGSGGVSYGGIIPKGFIQTQLNAGVDVLLAAGSSIKGSGLTNITATGTGNLKLGIGNLTSGGLCVGSLVCVGSTQILNAGFNPISNGRINLSGVTINIKGAFAASASFGSINLGNVTAKAITLAQASGQTIYTIKTGTLVATNGAIVANAGNYGSVSFTGDATAKNINITGEYVNTQNLTVTGTGASAVKIQGYGSLDGSYHIAVNGNIIASNGGVNINELGGYGVTVSGSITAAGPVSIMTYDSGGTSGAAITLNGPVTAKSITLNATAARNADITTKSLHANGAGTGDGVSVYTSASSVSYSGGQINVSGSIGALNGGVALLAIGGQDSGGKVSVSGNINAAGVVSVTGSNIGSCCGAIHLAKVTGGGISITLNEAGSRASGISVGSLTALNGNVSVTLHGGTSGGGSLHVNGSVKASTGSVSLINSNGNSIDVTGNISAASRVYISENNASSNSLNIGGNVKGSSVQIIDNGSG
ncbi:MAG: filamentous hemagglutinin N-terminal domain-containing protein, partial [Gammaproteobacteria bacterium]